MRTAIITIIIMLLAGCEYRYRYECQDPLNWGKESCNNDLCKAEGSCTQDVLGFSPGSKPVPTEIIESGQPEISNQVPECQTTAPTIIYRDRDVTKTIEAAIKQDKKDVEMEYVAEKTEKELTMNTIVETYSHNNAAKLN